MNEITVLIIFDFHHTPSRLSTEDVLISDLMRDGGTNHSKWHPILRTKQAREFDVKHGYRRQTYQCKKLLEQKTTIIPQLVAANERKYKANP